MFRMLAASGPSPRVRGAAELNDSLVAHAGSIPAGGGKRPARAGLPARAGSRRARCRPRASGRDHPRERGDKTASQGDRIAGIGPSPRVRGAGVPVGRHFVAVGSIPARTGSSFPSRGRSRRARVDLRTYGEQVTRFQTLRMPLGPSPHGQGADRVEPVLGVDRGSIPTRAGSRGPAGGPADRDRVHPRAGGEQCPLISGFRRAGGPSPRGRGAVFLSCSSTRHRPASKQLSPKQTKHSPGVQRTIRGEFGGEPLGE